jgi:hypothetical protein
VKEEQLGGLQKTKQLQGVKRKVKKMETKSHSRKGFWKLKI